jgi:hypothetical protein
MANVGLFYEMILFIKAQIINVHLLEMINIGLFRVKNGTLHSQANVGPYCQTINICLFSMDGPK